MPDCRRIIFWQPLDSPHQDDFLETVKEGFGGEMVLAVERPPLPAESPGAGPRASGPFRFVSAGQLIRRKGVDLLVAACAALPQPGRRHDIHGAGAERAALERLAMNRGLGDMVAFRGTVPNAHLQPVLAAVDCVVLPSRFDGWGVLVSKALTAGTPTICTDRSGSADRLRTIAGYTEAVGEVVPPRPCRWPRHSPEPSPPGHPPQTGDTAAVRSPSPTRPLKRPGLFSTR